MLLHAFPSIFVNSLREFPENYVYKHDGPNLLLPMFSLIILKGLKKRGGGGIYWICILKQ